MAWLAAHRSRVGDCIIEKFYPAAGLQDLDMLVQNGYRVILPQVKDMVIWVCPFAWRGDRFNWTHANIYVLDRWGKRWASSVFYRRKGGDPNGRICSNFDDTDHDFFHALSAQVDRPAFQGFFDCVHFDEACIDQDYYPQDKRRRLNPSEDVFGIEELRLTIREFL
jgi:hypothetical protein